MGGTKSWLNTWVSKSWTWKSPQCPSVGWMKQCPTVDTVLQWQWSVHMFLQAVLTNVMFSRSSAHAWFHLQNPENSRRSLCHQMSAPGVASWGWGAAGTRGQVCWVSESPSSQTRVMWVCHCAWITLHIVKNTRMRLCLGWVLWTGVPPVVTPRTPPGEGAVSAWHVGFGISWPHV